MLFLILLAFNILFLEFATLASLSNIEKSLSVMRLLVGNPSNSASFRFAVSVAHISPSLSKPYSQQYYNLMAPAAEK